MITLRFWWTEKTTDDEYAQHSKAIRGKTAAECCDTFQAETGVDPAVCYIEDSVDSEGNFFDDAS